jgi:hypothetical protein
MSAFNRAHPPPMTMMPAMGRIDPVRNLGKVILTPEDSGACWKNDQAEICYQMSGN